MRAKKLIFIVGFLVLTTSKLIASPSKNPDWIGVFTSDIIPIKGCYIEENYGIYWRQQMFNYIQWAEFKNENNYLNQFGNSIDKVLENIRTEVKKLNSEANAIIGAEFKFITNFEPLVSKNYYINGKRADGIGWGSVILIGNMVKVKCK